MKAFPYPYYIYGSADSTDTDVMIQLTAEEMPIHQEDRKRLVKKLTTAYQLDWNATLIVVKEGYIVDTIYPKAWVDNLNNALWHTYDLHEQTYPLPLIGELDRHYLLAIYKAVRTVLCMFTRTEYRPIIRPILKGLHPFYKKIDALEQLDFQTIKEFNQPNANAANIWKTVAFYMGQNMSLLKDNIAIYSKKECIAQHPQLVNFINRQPLTEEDFVILNDYKKTWLLMLEKWGTYESDGYILTCKNETVDMHKEISI